MSVDYNATLNLPKTDFPMRAGLPKREPDMLKQWDELDIYHRMVERNTGKPRFILHDGPPFSNGLIHMGTVLNKCIKDFIVRYKNMSGWQAPYVPGWDNHGMPIESAIIKQNKLDRKSMAIPEFRDACAEFAANFVNLQREQFMRLGVLGEWFKPYLTMEPRFEAEEVKVFGEMYQKGYTYKGKKPVYWCAHDETALAEAEIEYADHAVDSIYVKFPVVDDKGLFGKYCDLANLYFVIWTTTTWTIPGNLAICVGPDIEYSLMRAPNGDVYVISKELAPNLAKAMGIDGFEELFSIKGSELEFMRARHPLYDRESLVLLGAHVTLEAGTGCVHTAPGHGMEDFDICRKYDAEKGTKIGIVVPVDDHGHMTAESGKYDGMYYEKANKLIAEDLREGGWLVASERINHQYPHCWRCKNPVLYRATDQWFCSVDAFKDEAAAACDEVEWIPAWGHDRMTSMVRERADWCISRQRHWGLPIPVFYCSDCGKPICTPETIEKLSKLFGEQGSNVWFSKELGELLPDGFACPHCGGEGFYKINDTLDCWFDSGSTHRASLELDNPEDWPATMYLEGADQYRGWFQSSLLTSVATKGRAPYNIVLTHGWTVDGEGRQMHKSLGNGVAPEDIIPKYGAEILRLWAAASDYHSDMRCSDAIFKQLSDIYLKIRNTARYILGNLADFNPAELLPYNDLLPLDKWALSSLSSLIERSLNAYEKYEFHTVIHSVHNFCVVEMSNFYLDVIKDRLYCEKADSIDRRSAASTIYLILDAIVRLVAPVLAFTSNEIWQAMPHREGDDAQHIMMNDMPAAASWKLPEAEAERWKLLLRLRGDVNRAIEGARAEKLVGKPLDAVVTLRVSPEGEAEFAKIADMNLAQLFIVSEVFVEKDEAAGAGEFAGISVSVHASEEQKCSRCWTHLPTVGSDPAHPELCPRCAAAVS